MILDYILNFAMNLSKNSYKGDIADPLRKYIVILRDRGNVVSEFVIRLPQISGHLLVRNIVTDLVNALNFIGIFDF